MNEKHGNEWVRVCSMEEWDDEEEDREVDSYSSDNDDDRTMFADPGGTSALRAVTEDNPRTLPCGNCGQENKLTPADVALGYQCNDCADAVEGGGY